MEVKPMKYVIDSNKNEKQSYKETGVHLNVLSYPLVQLQFYLQTLKR